MSGSQKSSVTQFPFPQIAGIEGRLGDELKKRVASNRGNFWRMSSWNERGVLALIDLADALRGGQRLPVEIMEFVILRTAHRCGAVVPCMLHRHSALRSGVDATIVAAALDEGDIPQHPLLNDVSEVVDSLVANHCAQHDALARLKQAMGPAAALDIVQLTGFYITVSLVLNSCGIETEDKD